MGPKSSKQDKASNPLSRMQQEQTKTDSKHKKNKKWKKKLEESQDKNRRKMKKTRQNNSPSSSEVIQRKPINYIEFEKTVCLKLSDQIENDLSTFVMNQISLSVQFFRNYERKRTSIYNDNLEKEGHLNQHLEEHSIMLQNAVDKSIEQRIQFKPKWVVVQVLQLQWIMSRCSYFLRLSNMKCCLKLWWYFIFSFSRRCFSDCAKQLQIYDDYTTMITLECFQDWTHF